MASRRSAGWKFVLAGLATLLLGQASVQADVLSIGTNFTGTTSTEGAALAGFVYAPPDSMGAIGPTLTGGTKYYVEFINGSFAVYNSSTGAVVGTQISDTTFWTNAGISSSTLSAGTADPRILYDSDSERWFAVQITRTDPTNQILVAVSDTNDPTGTWKATKIDVTAGGTTSGTTGFADYPTMAVDAKGLYIGTNNFTSTYTNRVSLFAIPKADLIDGAPDIMNLARFEGLAANQVGFTLQGVVNNTSSNGVFYATDNNVTASSASTTLYRTELIGLGTASPSLSTTTLSLGPGGSYLEPPLARQPDDTGGPPGSGTKVVDTVDSRLLANVYQVGNYIYMAHTTRVNDGSDPTGTRAAIRITVINATTGALVTEATLGATGYDYFMPAIAANALGNVVIGFNRSGRDTSTTADRISSFAALYMFDGTSLTFQNSLQLVESGTDRYDFFNGLNLERWGDYSAITVDPDNPLIFWTIQEWAMSSSVWATQITQLTVTVTAAVPEPSSLVLVGTTLALGLAAYRRRRRQAIRAAGL